VRGVIYWLILINNMSDKQITTIVNKLPRLSSDELSFVIGTIFKLDTIDCSETKVKVMNGQVSKVMKIVVKEKCEYNAKRESFTAKSTTIVNPKKTE
jgi:hypothetical protein